MCFNFLDFEIQNFKFQLTLNVDMVNTKYVLVEAIYNFVLDKFLFVVISSLQYSF
jgi:hypothetical protein